jgi:hypothetical protein
MNTEDGPYAPRHAKQTRENRKHNAASMVAPHCAPRDVLRKEAAGNRDALCMVVVLYVPSLAQAIKVLVGAKCTVLIMVALRCAPCHAQQIRVNAKMAAISMVVARYAH